MATILPFSKQQEIKPITENNYDKYNQIATEIEHLELKKLIGARLLQDLQADPTSDNNELLLSGGTLKDGTKTAGLNFVIAFFNYARYVTQSYINDSYNGFTKQKIEESEQISEGERKRLINLYQETAMQEWYLVEKFLNENADKYPCWDCTKTSKVYTPKIYGIRKTYR